MDALPVSCKEICREHRTNPVLFQVLEMVATGQFLWVQDVDSTLALFISRKDELTVQQHCLMWGFRVVIPPKLRPRVLSKLHAGHPGVVKIKLWPIVTCGGQELTLKLSKWLTLAKPVNSPRTHLPHHHFKHEHGLELHGIEFMLISLALFKAICCNCNCVMTLLMFCLGWTAHLNLPLLHLLIQ